MAPARHQRTPLVAFQALYDADPSTISGNRRQSHFSTHLSYGATSSNIWENMSSFVYVDGPGAANGEINNFHGFLQVNAGAFVKTAEGFEASATNNGIVTNYTGYLGLFNNAATGTASEIDGAVFYLNNLNTAAGAVTVWNGINFPGMTGGGSRPSFYNAIRIADPNLGIATMGGILIGGLGNSLPGELFLQGANNSGGTFPLVMKNLAAQDVLHAANNGQVVFGMAGVTMQPPTLGASVFVQGSDNAAGSFPFGAKNLAGANVFFVNNSGQASVSGAWLVNSVQVVGPRSTGWVSMVGVADQSTAFNSGSVTLPQLASRVKSIQDALTLHGLLGA